MARKLDDYKPLKFYKDNTKAKQSGFSKFEVDGEHYFCRYVDGDIALISQSYAGKAGRDNGIESVRKNEKIKDRYRFETRDGGKHGFSLLAGNRQEIAVSPNYASESKAQTVAGRLNGSVKKAAPKKSAPKKKAPAKAATAAAATGAAFTSGDGRRGNYKPLDFYTSHGGTTQDGFDSFEHDGAYYFSYRKNGKIHLISESYTAAKGRDNGIASVEKNIGNKARYKHRTHSNGQHYFDLFAGNNQEIATSVWYDSEAAAMDAAAELRGEKPAKAPRAPNIEDNYRPLAFYTAAATGVPKNGIEKFRGEDGGYYFVYNEDGKVALISEAYPTAASRDTGAASVEKNISDERRYDYSQGGVDGKTGFRLRAGNNKEIARSIAYGSAAAATAGAAYLLGTRKRSAPKPKPPAPKPATPKAAPVAAAAVGAAALAGAGAAAARDPNRDKTDDYLACEAYEGHPVTDPVNRVALFQHDNGQHYFVFYDPDGDVRWRSEGFPTEAARQEELDIALRLHENGEYIKRLERGDRYIDLLHDETGREIARSCLCTLTPVAPVVAAAPVAAAAAAAAPAAVPATTGGFPGWLKWLLLGLLALLALWGLSRCIGGGDAPDVPAATAPVPTLVTCWDGSEAETRDACPARITCPDGTEVTDRADCPVEEPDEVETVAPTPAPTVTCWDGSTAATQAACPARPTVTCWDGSTAFSQSECPVRPTVTCWDGSTAFSQSECPARPVTTPTRATATQGRLAFFNVDACNGQFKRVSRLGTNPEYGDSHSLTPSAFYDKLAQRHALGGIDRTHLNALFRNLGYANGFADARPDMFSNATIDSGTTGILGYGSQHGLQCSNLLPTADRDLEAFAIQGANGRTVYFMKTCGNYFYPG